MFFCEASVDPIRRHRQADGLDGLYTAIVAQSGRRFLDACRSDRAECAA